VDAEQALGDLMEISSQVQAAVVLEGTGEVAAAAGTSDQDGRVLARAARALLDEAADIRSGAGESTVIQLEAATRTGSVFVVREGERVIAATTGRAPTVGLVFYDLKTCLRALTAEEPKAKAATPAKPQTGAKAPAKARAAEPKVEDESS
jgi:predicted regulator of Ras-like GTPase activity (Roadblock/LC7/MglB family)